MRRVEGKVGVRIRTLLASAIGLTPLILVAALAFPAAGQDALDSGPLLPTTISEYDVEIRGRFSRQWTQPDGTLVVQVNGALRVDFGKRQMRAESGVVWIAPRKSQPEGRKYYELTIYLAGKAEVREPIGATVEDNVLLVSNVRTFGRVVKYDDANSPESMERSELYQKALADRRLIESTIAAEESDTGVAEVRRPSEASRPQRPPRLIRYILPQGTEPIELADGTPVQVATGRVYFSQTGTPDMPVLEIQADSAVIFPAQRSALKLLGDEAGQPASRPASRAAASRPSSKPTATPGDALPSGEQFMRAVYLEGDVLIALGSRVVRASRVYYDFERQRALMLDGVFRADMPERNVPFYVRAEEIRQLSAREFSAENARVSTSEFYTPHYHVGAEKVYIYDRTPRDAAGQPSGEIQGTYELRGASLNFENVPLAYWPYSKGPFQASETLLRRIRTAYSDDFGMEVETAWYLFNLLGLETPPGVDATLKLDYFSERGPAAGVNINYTRDNGFGYFRGYYINDGGEDDFGPIRDNTPESANRGRVLWRHREYLPNDWELTLEGSHVSDPGFMEEYEKNEWFEDKQQEQAIYLKRAKDVDAITLLANWRSLDFVTQSEHLPDLTYRRIGDALDPFVLYHESRVGAVRYRPDDRRWFDERDFDNTGKTDATFRADAREEAELPIKLPGFNLVPFSTVRGSFWDGQPLDDGSLWRGLGVYGVRGSGWLSRVYDDVESDLFDIHRIRHVVQPHGAAWFAHSNTRSELITPFDEGIETVDAFYGAVVGLRQIWQTKRGPEGKQRTTDLLTVNAEVGAFGGEDIPADDQSNGFANPTRPEDSRARNYAALDVLWRISDSTAFLYDVNVDLDDWAADRHNVSFVVERDPRLSYVVGYRHAGDIDLDLVGGGWNYKFSEKHLTAVRIWYDTDRGRLGELTLAYVRKFPRWYVAVEVEIDEVFDDVSVSLSAWPEGVPEWTLGSRRYSGLGASTNVRE